MKIEIIILGLLFEESLYGYEIKKRIVERLGNYVDIKFGSIYYAIKKAVENGWVQKIGTERDSGNPERYVYELLSGGKKHYKKILRQYFDQKVLHFDIDVVLLFLESLSEDQKEEFLERRLESIKEQIAEMEEQLSGKKNTPTLLVHSYILEHLKAELNWLNSIN